MKSKLLLSLTFLWLAMLASAQTNTTDTAQAASIFQRLTRELSTFKPDTTAPPNDKITQKITELRKLRGGFNVNEAIAYKLQEEKQKGEMPADVQKKLGDFFTTGNGKRWLDNAVVHIYRSYFTYAELKELVRFYKTSAGQKMAEGFPVIMLKSMAAGEMLKTALEKEIKSN